MFNVILLMIYVFKKCNEHFSNAPLLVYNTEINTQKINIEVSPLDYSDNIKNKCKGIKNIVFGRKSPTGDDQRALLTDTLTYSKIHPSLKVITVVPEEKVFMLFKPKDRANNESLTNVVSNKKVIGYFEDIDTYILKSLLVSLDVDPTKVRLKKISMSPKIDAQWFQKQGIYACLMFTPLSNTALFSKLSNTFLIDFIQYEDFQVDKLKFMLPFVKMKNQDLSLIFPTFKDKYSVKSCLMFDMVICGPSALENNVDVGLELNQLIVRMGNSDVINYYTMFFEFFKHSVGYIDKMNEHIQNRDSLPILEQFSSPIMFDIEPKENIEGGFYSSNRFELGIDSVDGVPLTVGTRVTLSQQFRDEENGKYIVKTASRDKTVLDRYLYFDTGNAKFKANMLDVSNLSHIDVLPVHQLMPSDVVWLTNMKQFAKVQKTKGKTYLVLITQNPENPTYDPRYECYGEQQIKSRGLCESKYDASGRKLKTKTNYWDRRCEKNDECPFYQANKNYKNYFGGCIDGYCQLPLGLKQVSYRKIDGSSKAMCYNCKDPLDPFCCEDQKNRSKYPHLKSPDYAFPLDGYERMKQLKVAAAAGKVRWYNS
jgi:hypothetical protein